MNLSFMGILAFFITSFSSLNAKSIQKDTIIKTVYVTNRNGIKLKQAADKNSATIDSMTYGQRLEVIRDSAEWFGIRFQIHYGEPEMINTVYILKKQTGSINDLSIIPSELNIINSLNKNSKIEFIEKEKTLNEFIQIELVSQEFYDSMKKTVINLLSFDSSQFSKENGVLKLKCKKKTRKFIDIDGHSENLKMYDYAGEYTFLNQFIVLCSYYETGNFTFVDKSSGKIAQVFGNFPNVSPNKNHLLCVGLNHFEMEGQIELFSIVDSKIKRVFYASFPKWFLNGPDKDMFWGTDNCFYLPVNNIFTLQNEYRIPDERQQYIRIKIR